MNYFTEFCEERNIKQSTIKGYRTAVNRYTAYYETTLEELIDEAIAEENDRDLDKRKRSIKSRLIQFRTHLLTETDLKHSTIRKTIKDLQTIYNHFDIELPNLPTIQYDDKIETTYFDLPTKRQIGMAIENTGVRLGSLILFMASSGTGRTECANMTIGDFINGCRDYFTTEGDLKDILEELYGSIQPIVPTLYLHRQKTNKKYYTFCTPEASHKIIEWLLLRIEIAETKGETITLDDTLWDWSIRQITYHFHILNDELKFGFKGSQRFFRPHTLRKFNASNIGLEEGSIDLLQGRSRDSVHETYIKTNPSQFKEKYMTVMENVTINKIHKDIKHEEFTININLNFYGYTQTVTL